MKRSLSRRGKKPALSRDFFERLATKRHALDVLAVGVITLDAEANAIFMNEEATAILKMNDGLSIAHGRLALTHTADTRELLSALKQACRKDANSTFRTFRISRPSGRQAYQCVVSLLDGELKLQYSQSAVAMIFLTDPERFGGCRALFVALYSLTPKEAHLAELMAQGESIARASERMGIMTSTARSHLKHLMLKVGAKRQAELISVLLKAPPVRYPTGNPISNAPGLCLKV